MGQCEFRVCLAWEHVVYVFRVLMCIDCSGIHRNLGVHISTVKSLTLDKWQQKWIDTVSRIGNRVSNAYYENRLPSNFRRPGHSDGVAAVENFIRTKYVKKEYAPKGEEAPCDLVSQGVIPSRIASPPGSTDNSPVRGSRAVSQPVIDKKISVVVVPQPAMTVDLLGGLSSPNRSSPRSSAQSCMNLTSTTTDSNSLLDKTPFPPAPSSPSRSSHVIRHYHHVGHHPYSQPTTAFPSFSIPSVAPHVVRSNSPPKSKPRGGLNEIDPFASLLSRSKKF